MNDTTHRRPAGYRGPWPNPEDADSWPRCPHHDNHLIVSDDGLAALGGGRYD